MPYKSSEYGVRSMCMFYVTRNVEKKVDITQLEVSNGKI